MRTIGVLAVLVLLSACGASAPSFTYDDPLVQIESSKPSCRLALAEDGYADPVFGDAEAQLRNPVNQRDLIVIQGVATERASGEQVDFVCRVDRTAFNDYVTQDLEQEGDPAEPPPPLPVEMEYPSE